MKKIVYIAATLLLLVLGTAPAQRRWTGVLELGYQSASCKNIDAERVHSGFRAGIGADYAFLFRPTTVWSLRSGVYYNTKGYSDKSWWRKRRLDLHYIDIPLLLQLRIGASPIAGFLAHIGPYAGIGIGTHEQVSDALHSYTDNSHTFGEELAGMDIGLQLGGGIELYPLSLQLSYQMGLVPLGSYRRLELSNETSTAETNYYNRSLFITLGYRF